MTNRDWTRCIRLGRTGSGRSSPSERSPDVAVTLNATVLTPGGTERWYVRLVPPPAGTATARRASAAPRPKRGERSSFVSGSRSWKAIVPFSSPAEALLTTTFRSATSPSRRKRGTYGRTISSLTLFVSFFSEPARRSFVTAWSQTFQDVTESGTANSIDAEPSGPVRSCGAQNAVSAKLLRSAGASVAGGVEDASPASFFLSATASSACSSLPARRD